MRRAPFSMVLFACYKVVSKSFITCQNMDIFLPLSKTAHFYHNSLIKIQCFIDMGRMLPSLCLLPTIYIYSMFKYNKFCTLLKTCKKYKKLCKKNRCFNCLLRRMFINCMHIHYTVCVHIMRCYVYCTLPSPPLLGEMDK